MANNMASQNVTQTSMQVRGWYGGTETAQAIALFFNGQVLAWEDAPASGTRTNWTTNWYSVSGLSPGTTYNAEIWVYRSDWTFIETGTYQFTTLAPSDTTPPTCSIISPSSGHWTNSSSLTITANATDNVAVDYVNFFNATLGTLTATSPSSGTRQNGSWQVTFNISSLGEGSHSFAARAYDTSGNFSPQDSITINIDRTNPACSITSHSNGAVISGNSVTVTANASDSASGVWRVAFWITDSNGNVVVFPEFDYSSPYSATLNISGLAQGTYNLRAQSQDNANNVSTISSVSVTKSNRPTNWEWNSTELNAFNKVSGFKVSDVSHTRWNDFIDRVNEFRVYKGLSTIGGKMSSGDKTLTATRFNTVKNGIGSMNATGITDRSAGQQVLGSYFITLRDKLNEIT